MLILANDLYKQSRLSKGVYSIYCIIHGIVMFFFYCLGGSGLHPNKSKASSLDIAHSYWVAYVNICRRRIWIFHSIQRCICHLFCILYDIMLDFYVPYENCCREVAPQRFLFEWKSASEKEVAPPCFLFQSKSASHAEVAPLDFYFWTEIRFPCYRRGGRSSHVLLPCAFSRHIRQPTQACTRAKRENSRLATYTAPVPFSPSLMR